jgi:hypothetical protein
VIQRTTHAVVFNDETEGRPTGEAHGDGAATVVGKRVFESVHDEFVGNQAERDGLRGPQVQVLSMNRDRNRLDVAQRITQIVHRSSR